jgi:mono/diheme cytochrome c family protein
MRRTLPTLIHAALILSSLGACSREPSISAPTQDVTQAAASQQSDPAIYRGAAIAGQVCSQCHESSGAAGGGKNPNAPALAVVANRPGTNEAGLRHWLTTQHPSMPNYIFDEATVRDLVAYIMSLRRA